LIVAGAVMLSSHPATAETIADFYRGKSISLYVSFRPAAATTSMRAQLAPHFTRHSRQSHHRGQEHGAAAGSKPHPTSPR
jgi:hypothetical protein